MHDKRLQREKALSRTLALALLFVFAAAPEGLGSGANEEITAEAGSFKRKIPKYFSGFNGNVLSVPGWADAGFLEKVKELRPGNLRYPAGTVANYWDWRSGWFLPGLELPHNWNSLKPFPITLENFKAAVDATGAAPVWDLNILTSNLKEQIAMLREAEKLGFLVRYVELGNEMYLEWDDYKERFPTPASYGRTAKRWAKKIKKEFPNALVAVIGVATWPDEARSRNQNWNKQVLKKTADVADAVTLHPYNGIGLDRQPFTDPAIPLSVPFYNWESRRGVLDELPPGMEVWITEYNMLEGRGGTVQRTWTHGLYAATMTLLFLDEKQITLICNHNIAGVANGAVAGRNGHFSISANGVVMKMINAALEGAKRAREIVFSPLPQVESEGGYFYPALLGWLFEKGPSHQAIILNLSEQARTLNIKSLFEGEKVPFLQTSGNPLAVVNSQAELTWSGGKTKSKLTLPPYSISGIGITEGDLDIVEHRSGGN